MDIETLRSICLGFPGSSEQIKWDDDLCFMVAGKMFCIAWLGPETKINLKVDAEEFEELISRPFIEPAPYLARAKWICIRDSGVFNPEEWQQRITHSYELIRDKLPKKIREGL